MKSIIYYFSMISIFFFLSCTGWKDKKNMESDIITVNLDERDEISTKDLFSEIQLIPLETTPESLIRNITQIKFFEDRYYIHDYSRSQIFVFDREGHFQFALNEKGNGPGEYLNLTDFAIDTTRRNLVVLCAVSNALFFYDLGGKFIEKKKLPEIAGAYNSLQFQNKDTIAFFTYDYDHRLKFYSLSRNEILDEYFPEDIKDVFCRGVFPFPHAFRRSLTNTIYSLSGATFTELYRWDFGDLNNDIEKLEFHPNMSKQEIIQYAKDVYSSKSVNYIIAYWGTDSLDSFSLSNLCNDKKLFFCFSEKTCPPCIDAVVDIMNEVFTDEEIKTKIVFVSPDYPARLRNDCYGKKLLSLHNKNLGLPMELEDSFAPFLFIMDKDLCVKYLHIHNKPLPRLTLIYLEEIKKMW